MDQEYIAYTLMKRDFRVFMFRGLFNVLTSLWLVAGVSAGLVHYPPRFPIYRKESKMS